MAKFLFSSVFILSTLTRLSLCAGSQTASTLWQSAHSAVKSLGDDAYSYLVSLLGKQSVDTLQKTTWDAVKVASQTVAHALNVVAVYITNFLAASGIDAKLPVKHFTPEGVLFVVKWAFLAVLGYWLMSMAVCLLVGLVRRTLFLLKVTFALATFGVIMSDGEASAETTAMRLAGLVFACVLLGIGPSSFRGDPTVQLENKVKVLEKRLKEMEKKTKEE